MKNTFPLLMIIACTGWAACSGPSKNADKEARTAIRDSGYKKIGYDTAILSSEKKCAQCETWDALFYDTAFVNIYENPSFYIDDCLSFLSNASFSERQKMTCICSMQNATLTDYLKIAGRCKELFDAGKLSEYLLIWSLVPNFSEKNRPIVPNYDDARVKDLLQKVRQDKISGKSREMIDGILSGELWDHIQKQYNL